MEDEKKETKEVETLPEPPAETGGETGAPDPAEAAEKRARELEIQNARLEGELAARKVATNVAPEQKDAWKQAVWSDINGLDDDSFEQKYKMKKHQASTAILQEELKNSSNQTRQEVAELRAEQRLAMKYPDFFEHKTEIREAMNDLAPDVRQDPERLAKAMERAYVAAAGGKKDEPKVEAKPPKGESGMQKRVVSSFEKPAPPDTGRKKEDKDEIPEEYRPLAKAFGITSEAERKDLMKNEFCEMNLGGGVVFRDPERGFEQIQK